MAFEYYFVSTVLVNKPFTRKRGLACELVGTHAEQKNQILIPGLDSQSTGKKNI